MTGEQRRWMSSQSKWIRSSMYIWCAENELHFILKCWEIGLFEMVPGYVVIAFCSPLETFYLGKKDMFGHHVFMQQLHPSNFFPHWLNHLNRCNWLYIWNGSWCTMLSSSEWSILWCSLSSTMSVDTSWPYILSWVGVHVHSGLCLLSTGVSKCAG